MNQGLKRGTREWLFAMRAWYTSDPDVVALTELLEEAWDKLVGKQKELASENAESEDDEWSSGG